MMEIITSPAKLNKLYNLFIKCNSTTEEIFLDLIRHRRLNSIISNHCPLTKRSFSRKQRLLVKGILPLETDSYLFTNNNANNHQQISPHDNNMLTSLAECSDKL